MGDHLAYQKRNDLNLYEKNYLESTFIKITNASTTNIILDCIYRHPTMNPNEFKLLSSTTFRKTSQRTTKKLSSFLVTFNVDLLKYEQHKATNEFLDSLSSNMFLPYSIQPTRN